MHRVIVLATGRPPQVAKHQHCVGALIRHWWHPYSRCHWHTVCWHWP